MKFLKIINWVIYIAIFVLALVLVINNIQTAQFNFFGVYYLKLPLIVLALIFLCLGFIVGIILSSFKIMKLKTEVRVLNKQLHDKIISENILTNDHK